MDRTYYSIFNDVLGPVMTGPSSSHSAGCARIGKTARSLFGREIYRAEIVFEEKGSYPGTYIGQGSNFGFTGGLMGYSTDDVRLKDAVSIAKAEGRSVSFKKADLGFHHPNEAEILVYGDSGEVEMTLRTYSVGGGMFLINEMDGFRVSIDGGEKKVFVLCRTVDSLAETQQLLTANGIEYVIEQGENGTLVTVNPEYGTDISEIEKLREKNGIGYVRVAEPVLPVIRRRDAGIPFFSAKEAYEYHEITGKQMWEMAIDYECSLGYVTVDEINEMIDHIADVMEKSTVAPDADKTEVTGFLPYSCRLMEKKIQSRRTVGTGLLGKAMLSAIAVMENSCAHNIIVAAPTAGSSGVVPAAIVSVGRQLDADDEEIKKALLAAGLVGVFIANQATFGGEVGACQAENGSAAAMAAAGVVQLMGGSAEEGFRAASAALQNMLGLICDPIAGLTEIPCISRNVAAMSNAVMCADMVIAGFDPVIPLDETILTMKKVGEQLPPELRCTCEGGLCKTPTGCRITECIEKKRPKQ